MNSVEKLKSRTTKGMHICVGLDTDMQKIPTHYPKTIDSFLEFNKRIIDATKELAAAYKINLAFYERLGSEFYNVVMKTINYIPENILIIGDAKRGDIGNTSKMYAEAIFDEMNFDAITLHPYMGYDSIQPFLDFQEKLSFVLALTSNKGAEDFEKQKLSDGSYLFQQVINKVKEWDINNNAGFVFGATNLKELTDNLDSIKGKPILLPGVGAQGGDAEGIANIFNENKIDAYLINVSRGLLYSDSTKEFEKETNKKMNYYTEIFRPF